MKYKHTITIADIQMNIITEEQPEVVEAMVGVLDRRMREIFLKTENRCPKIEAALLCALDYCAERNKLQDTVNRMEEELKGVDIPAMLAELDALKGENDRLASQLTYTEDQARTMKSGIDIANDQIRILKTQVDEAEAKALAVAGELESAKAATADAEALEAKIAELEAALAAKTAECEEKTAECIAKTAECEAKAAEYDKLCEAFENVSEKIEALSEEIDDLGDDVEELAEDIVEEIVETLAEDGDDTVTVEIIAEDSLDGQPVVSCEVVEEADVEPVLADDINMMVEEVVEEAAEETAEVVAEITEEAAEEKAGEPVKRPVAEIADNIVDAFELDMKPLRRSNVDDNQLTIDSEIGGETTAEKTSVEKEKQKAHKRVRSMFDLITFDNV